MRASIGEGKARDTKMQFPFAREHSEATWVCSWPLLGSENLFRSGVAGLNLLHVWHGTGVDLLLGRTTDERRCRYLGLGINFWLVYK